jgi:hypothetical protein
MLKNNVFYWTRPVFISIRIERLIVCVLLEVSWLATLKERVSKNACAKGKSDTIFFWFRTPRFQTYK